VKNTPSNKYNELVEQIKQALTIIFLNADIIGTGESLNPEGEKCLEKIRSQALRINRQLDKAGGEIKQEREQVKTFLSEIRTQNNAIAKRLASIIVIIGSTRASQLGIDVMLTDLEENI
jgi:uncharacterized protein YlxW (UPF0749 family)